MPLNHPAQIAGLYRYPVKGLSPEQLARIGLSVGQTLPADRRYAIENGPSGFDPLAPAWMPKTNFLMLMRNERLAGLRSHFDDSTNRLTIRENGKLVARGDLETTEGRAAIEAFFAVNFAQDLKGPPKVIAGRGHSFSDVAKKVVSIVNLGSIGAIEDMVGLSVHPLRFRANVYVSGWPAWHEFELVGETLAIGEARLKVVKLITRCAAINVDPHTAARDLDIPPTLMRRLGHAECGDLCRGDRRRPYWRRRCDRGRRTKAGVSNGKVLSPSLRRAPATKQSNLQLNGLLRLSSGAHSRATRFGSQRCEEVSYLINSSA